MASTQGTKHLGSMGRRHAPPWSSRGTHHRHLAVGAALAASALALALGTPATGVAAATTTRTLLSVVDSSISTADAAASVAASGGQVVAVYAVADALLVDLPDGAPAPAGTVRVSDVALHVAAVTPSAATVNDVSGATYRATIGATDAKTGAGVTVAVVDTGVADVADLAGRIRHVNVSGGATGDGLGHGTFMAGLIAGDGSSSAGQYTGVAPDARILDIQVATADGSTSLSRVLAGLQAVADAAVTDRSVRVVSLALSTGSPLPPSSDPLARALDRLWARGMTVVVAAGNDGPDAGSVTSPGADPTVITVGSLDEHATSARSDDSVSEFSSRGTLFGTQKPDLVAPGKSLVSTRAPGSSADVENPASRVGDAYFTGSGTSMSEAVTAGAAAVLIGTRSALTPDSVKRLLVSNAYRAASLAKSDGAGKGGLDLAAALADAPSIALLKPSRGIASLANDLYGPSPADAAAWADFSDAWTAGDLEAVGAAWATLSEQTRRWAATAFALSMVSDNAQANSEEFAALEMMARSWATQAWNARSWASDAFVARSWAARSWAARSWAIADWAARSWADSTWSARSWALTDWTARSWADAQWLARSWAARSWADASWSARSWAQVDWLTFAWVARSWAARSWAADSWLSQSWSARSWAARSWADFAWVARSWAVDGWSARSWSADSWADAASGPLASLMTGGRS
jgi:serine protease AprX